MPYGLNDVQWENALEEAKEILVGHARNQSFVSYSDLVNKMKSAPFNPRSLAFTALLSDLSTREYREGRGMLTVLVVRKGGDRRPGSGFFELARKLGLEGDDEAIWISQFNRVVDCWRRRENSGTPTA